MKNQKFKTQAEAAAFTRDFLAKLTPKKAHKLVTKNTLEGLNQMGIKLGLLGWYYNPKEDNTFCIEALTRGILLLAIDYQIKTNS